ncbi:restriction endonuclease subunit S [Campylobacter coli]
MTNLPQGWEVKTLSEIGEIITGSTPSKSNVEFYGKDYPFFKPSDFEQGYFLENAGDNLSKLGFDKARQLPPKTILVVCIGSLGKVALTRVIGSCNQQINAIIPHKNIIAEYIYYYCISSKFQSILFSKAPQTTLAILNKTEFSKLEIIYPKNIKEQERIVGILDESFAKIDESIKILEQDLLNLDELMQSALQKAFNPLKDNAKENYKLPQGWEWKSLNSVLLKTSNINPCDFNENKFYYIDISSIDNKNFCICDIKIIDKQNAPSRARKDVLCGDILYATTRPNLKNIAINYYDFNNIVASTGFCVLRANKNLNNKYLFFFLLSDIFDKNISKYIRGTQYPSVSDKDVFNSKIPLPPLQEQEQIASHLDELSSHVKNLKQNYQAQIKDLQELKNSLLDKAFKGNL